MASPQSENGHVDLAHEIVEALAKYPIPTEPMRCLWVVLRKTYGWKKLEDEISLSQFVVFTGLKRPNVVRAIRWLVSRRILGSITTDTTFANKYKFNKDFDQWIGVGGINNDTRRRVVSPVIPKVVSPVITRPVSPVIHTKENSTKETIKRKGRELFLLPEWVDHESWEAYEEMRKAKKKPATDRARVLVIKELDRLRGYGQDPNSCLNQSTRNGWTDVYAVKGDNNGSSNGGGGGAGRVEPKSFHQRDVEEAVRVKQAVRARLGVFGGGTGLGGKPDQVQIDGRRANAIPAEAVLVPETEDPDAA